MTVESGQPLRILHCIHSLSGGGAENQLRILTSVSHQHGLTSAIFCVNTDRHQIQTDQVRLFQSAKRNKYNFSVFSSLSRAIEEFHPHVLHAWLPASLTMPGMLLAALRRIPAVFSYRSAMHFHRPLTLPEFACAALCSSQVVSNNPIENSHWLYRWLYRIKQGVEIPNAVHVDPQFLKPHPRPSDSTPTPYTILFAGRLVPEKNWRCLLQAINLIRSQRDVRLLVCGEGPERDQLASLVDELRLNTQVRLMGFRSDLHALMQQADVFVLPSWFEGMPNVLLEALAIGLPAIVSDIPSHRRIVKQNGCALLFDPASAEQLADAIHVVANSPTRRLEMVQAGRTLAGLRTPDELAEQYRALYERLLAHYTSGPITASHRMHRTSVE